LKKRVILYYCIVIKIERACYSNKCKLTKKIVNEMGSLVKACSVITK